MKILHIGKYYWPTPGGIETAVRDVAVEQVRQGHKVWVLAHWQYPGRPAEWETREGVNVYRVPIWGHVAYAPLAPSFPRAWQRIVSSVRPDIIHVHMPNLSPLFPGLCTGKAPVVVHWHADVYTSFKSIPLALLYPGYAVFQNKLLHKADAVVATSDAYRQASKPLQYFANKTVVIPLALDPDRMCSDPGSGSVSPRMPFVLSVGRFTYYKGFEVLIRAAAHLPEKVTVVIAGDGPLSARMRKQIIDLDLKDKLLLPGSLPDEELHALMAQCSVFCLPCIDRTEAFGLVLLEAMHYARPLVSTSVWGSGMQLVNEHGVTGLCVEPGDEYALAQALHSLLYNPERARNMGQAGKKRVQTEFHISQLVHRLDRLYRRLVS